jgi:uncharacterized RDD family membrane protein YckC
VSGAARTASVGEACANIAGRSLREPPHRAGLPVRGASLIYEAILLVPLLFIGGWLFLALTHDAGSPLMRALFRAWLLLLIGGYFVYCWVRGGQTLAMKTWRLRVATRTGRALSWRQATARYVVAVLGVGLFGLGLLWALIDPERQFLHDRLAGTRIFRAQRRGSSPSS